MACKRKLLAILIMALTFSSILVAQTFDNDACYIVETDEGIQYYQRFEWEPVEFASKYEFQLYLKKGPGMRELIESIETKEPNVSIPLEAGSFEYTIIVYNLLGRPDSQSEFIPFEIKKVYQPEVSSVSPGTVYLENQDGEITLSGKGLLSNSTIIFTSEDGVVVPVENLGADEKFKELTFFADPLLLAPGNYTVRVENEGGLSTTYESVTIKFKKAWDFDLSLGLTCLVNIFDSKFEEYFGKKIWPLGASFKMSLMPIKQSWGYLGFGLNGHVTLIDELDNAPLLTGYKISGRYVAGYFDIVYQYPIRNKKKNNNLRAIFEGHAGAGLVLLNDITFFFPNNIMTDPFNVLYLSAQVGGSVQYYFTKRLYAELNCDFTFTPSVDITMGNLVPSIMIGWQF